jgi:hypothetical protein
MSISSILSSSPVVSGFSVSSPSAKGGSALNQLRQQFQQLGQDLQSGKLSAAQTDFTSLQQGVSTSFSALGHNPITQALKQLQTQLQSGDVAGTPTADGPPIQVQNQTTSGHLHHHRHSQGPTIDPTVTSLGQGLDQLGQALQSNNLSAAQQAYNTMLQGLPLSLSNSLLSAPALLSQPAGSLSLSA